MSFFGRAVRAIMSRTSRIPKKTPAKRPVSRSVARRASRDQFDEVLALIDAARRRAYAQVNTTLIQLYWNVGEYISGKPTGGMEGQSDVPAIQRRSGCGDFSATADEPVLRDLPSENENDLEGAA